MIGLLDRRIERLDRQIAAIIEKTPALAARARLLAPVPGIGPTVLATLLGELAELGTICRRRIASLAGLALHARESGTWRGARRSWGGRRKVRETLYIAALTATRRIPSNERVRRLKSPGCGDKVRSSPVREDSLAPAFRRDRPATSPSHSETEPLPGGTSRRQRAE